MEQITFTIKNLKQTNYKQFYYVHSSLIGNGWVTGLMLHAWYFKLTENKKHSLELGIGRMVNYFG